MLFLGNTINVTTMNLMMNARRPTTSVAAGIALLALGAFANCCHAIEIDGFTEPNRSVDVASPEQGIVTEIAVRVGDLVSKGQIIARLDDELHAIMLETARRRKDARGRLESAEAEVRMKKTRWEKLSELRQQGFGRKEEVDRAAAEYEIAEAELKATREDLIDKKWQFEKINAELKRRSIRSPLDGVVAVQLKEVGEYVAPNEPNVMTIVELDPLLAKFSMKRSLARHLRIGDEVQVRLESRGFEVTGIIDTISPVIDAQSGTIKVKVRLENPDHAILSGERCQLSVPSSGRSLEEAESEQKKVAFNP